MHAGGISSALAAILAGAKHAFLPKFTAAELSSAIAQHQVTAMIAVPTMLQDLVQYHLQQTTNAVVRFPHLPVGTTHCRCTLPCHDCICLLSERIVTHRTTFRKLIGKQKGKSPNSKRAAKHPQNYLVTEFQSRKQRASLRIVWNRS
jgi:acyl-CoA synthetase (AMP-forming)/AMP-acid ligase II